MAKSLRSMKKKRLRMLRREIAEPFYDKKEVAKIAAQEAALAAPKLPIGFSLANNLSMARAPRRRHLLGRHHPSSPPPLCHFPWGPAIDNGLKKLKYLSLVSKICMELESHVGCGDKVLAEFITDLSCKFEMVEELDAKLKENGAKMPDYFFRTLLTIIHRHHTPKSQVHQALLRPESRQEDILHLPRPLLLLVRPLEVPLAAPLLPRPLYHCYLIRLCPSPSS